LRIICYLILQKKLISGGLIGGGLSLLSTPTLPDLIYPKYYKKDHPLSNLKPGAILMCSLAFSAAEHTGIYLGDGNVAELKGSGEVRSINIYEFINSTEVRTGVSAFAACDINGNIFISKEASKNAKSTLGDYREYNLVTNNCHKYTAGCLTGNFENVFVTFTLLESLIKVMFQSFFIRWRRIEE